MQRQLNLHTDRTDHECHQQQTSCHRDAKHMWSSCLQVNCSSWHEALQSMYFETQCKHMPLNSSLLAGILIANKNLREHSRPIDQHCLLVHRPKGNCHQDSKPSKKLRRYDYQRYTCAWAHTLSRNENELFEINERNSTLLPRQCPKSIHSYLSNQWPILCRRSRNGNTKLRQCAHW